MSRRDFFCLVFNLAFASKRGKRGPRLEWRRGWTLLTDGSKYGFLLLLIKVQEQGGGTYRTDDLPQHHTHQLSLATLNVASIQEITETSALMCTQKDTKLKRPTCLLPSAHNTDISKRKSTLRKRETLDHFESKP